MTPRSSFAAFCMLFATTLYVAAPASAHMYMATPPSLKSKITDPTNPDYTPTAPLADNAMSAGTYPCKGYHKDKSLNQKPVATYKAGESTTVVLDGVILFFYTLSQT